MEKRFNVGDKVIFYGSVYKVLEDDKSGFLPYKISYNGGYWVGGDSVTLYKEKEMDIREAYKVMQAASNIEIGDKVKVLRLAKDYEMGWNDVWAESMGYFVGKVHEVTGLQSEGRGVELDKYYCFPFFVLEIVKKCSTRTVTIDGKDIKISKESFEELKKQLIND